LTTRDADTQNCIGLIYLNGPQDLINAYVWFSLAASQGNSDGHQQRDLTTKLMTAAQIVEAHYQLGAKYGKGLVT
jgi:TPR repeat protein